MNIAPIDPTSDWPSLNYAAWRDTLDTLHRWTQIVGKIRLVSMPWISHSWHAPLYVTPVGMTTSTFWIRNEAFDIEFDLVNHRLVVRRSGGESGAFSLRPQSVASFYRELMDLLASLGAVVDIYTVPSEIPDPVRFELDEQHASYDRDAVYRFGQVLRQSTRVFTDFRSRFIGKVSPVHFFWGSFDLAVTRFSGRPAPTHPGGVPGLPDWITREAYSHEVYSCGFWPGGETSPAPAFYAYAYPVPDGLGAITPSPSGAFWSSEMREFFLPYEVVRAAEDPDAALMSFLDSTYDAVADLARWDRDALEAPPGFPTHYQ